MCEIIDYPYFVHGWNSYICPCSNVMLCYRCVALLVHSSTEKNQFSTSNFILLFRFNLILDTNGHFNKENYKHVSHFSYIHSTNATFSISLFFSLLSCLNLHVHPYSKYILILYSHYCSSYHIKGTS